MKAEIVFHPDEKGELNSLTLKLNGAHKAIRIPADPWSPDNKQLAACVGRYFSEELETFFSITIIDQELALAKRRWKDTRLSPISENLLLSEQGTELQFQEREDG